VKKDARENTRFEHQSPVTREDIQSGIHYGAKMYNYSKEGLYFEADYLLQPDEEIFIGIENSPYASATGIYECYRARVIWCKELGGRGDYLYGYGIQFYYPNYIIPTVIEGDDTGQATSLSPDPTHRVHSREYPRRPYVRKIIFASRNKFYEGLVKNISRKGAFIQTPETFAAGQHLTLLVPLGNKKKGIKLRGKVVWSSIEGFGIEFMTKKKD
jgi:Tfp pilus assembly protein PilZ